jgi:DNA-binding XRE family transcriptional regulator
MARMTIVQGNDMPNMARALKEEVLQSARKELRRQTTAFGKASAQYGKDIAEMKCRLSDLQMRLALLERQMLGGLPPGAAQADTEPIWVTPRSLRAQRRRLGLSAADFGRLLGVEGQTIYRWERGTSRPHQLQMEEIASLRRVSKGEVIACLEQMKLARKRRP